TQGRTPGRPRVPGPMPRDFGLPSGGLLIMTATTNINLISKPGQKVKPLQQKRARKSIINAGPPLLVFVLFIAVWWIVSATIYADRNYLLPRPPAVIQAMVDNWSLIAEGTWITFTSAVTGFIL